ncbi:MAG: NAD(P)H-dependent oxidoreductase subunit E, partial [Saprospiraceae bacterium]|nr:NAD(P)H-dependent oxidoreductase subunit E [Saprospiraceae bacterium]
MKRTETLDTLWSFQKANGYLSNKFLTETAGSLGISRIELDGVVSFYHFLHQKSRGDFTIYLNNSIISECRGYSRIREAFERETGSLFGNVDPTGQFGLYETACIGLSDQEPAALINFYPFTNLTTLKVRKIISQIKKGIPLNMIADEIPDNIHFTPGTDKAIFLREYHPGRTVLKLANLGAKKILNEVKESNIRGMGGAFFPAWIKLDSCARAKSDKKYIVCNADEGEPGTFKDRILLRSYPGLLLEGMITAAYLTGADEGVIYLRAEYDWLKNRVQFAIDDFNKKGFLGNSIAGIDGFNFMVRIQLGAGAYVCGEETALLNSMEGKRGEPRVKQYFPTECGFLNRPTLVNNVETLCSIARVVELGSAHFLKSGSKKSPGTKIISVSGDCHLPGIYEIEWGTKVSDILKWCQAENPYYIQVSGPSGQCLSQEDFDREVSPEDVRCGGSFMIFNANRDVLAILQNFARFFKHESCGVCTPCRAGNFIIERKLEKIANGLAHKSDFDELRQWGRIMNHTSRCGLGQTATNSLLVAIDKFADFFAEKKKKNGMSKKFD